MDISKTHFDEAKQSQLTFVELLINLGYRYISAKEAIRERKGDTGKFILHDIAMRKLSEINSYEYDGKRYKFSEEDVQEIIYDLENIQFEGLIDTSRKVYEMIMPACGGKSVKVFHGNKSFFRNFRFIDFSSPEKNDFAVTVDFEATGKNNIRVDIVVFVNGIPFAIIENSGSSVPLEDALNRMKRNQTADYCSRLFAYPQLLIGTNKEEFKYGTTGTPNKFYAGWKEKDAENNVDKRVRQLVRKPIDADVYEKLLFDLNRGVFGYKQELSRAVTEQDRSVVALFRKDQLLDLAKNCILYDAGVKKIMRYQQYFAVKKILKMISNEKEGVKGKKKREGGIIWHTQGSGKSLTMVMLVKALIEDPDIVNPRVLVVTDRKDLDRQIKKTFQNSGIKKETIQARSGQHLLELIAKKDLRVVTTLVHKFKSAAKNKTSLEDLDENIFVLIDEAHRTQSGMANLEMNKIIPNACYLAFTGTPLLRKEKSRQKFGNFIDRYTIDDALKDKIILPLIYEGRYVGLRQNKKEIDKKWNRLTEDLNERLKNQLQLITENKIIQDNPRRITEIAYDIEKHYLDRFQGTGLKGQIVAPSKFSAVLFQKYFQDRGKINTALVISDESGIIDEKDEHKKEIDEYLKTIKDSYQSLLSYEKEVIDSFQCNDDGVELLIVVDKLLTGFDAPRNTVLYLAKDLRDHNLLQAIARVNRLFENDVLPKTAGYIIDYSENARNIKSAMELFGNYDKDDVAGTLLDVNEKIRELEDNYAALHRVFETVKGNEEAYLQFLKNEGKRREFYDALNRFLNDFSECMVLQGFVCEFGHLDMYRDELKRFMKLRKTASFRYADRIDFSKYKQVLIRIMDDNIKAEEAELLTKQIAVTDKKSFDKAVEEMGSDRSKAEAIACQTSRIIDEKLGTDPKFYKNFSDKIEEILREMHEGKMADIEALGALRKVEEEMDGKKDCSIPRSVKAKPGADIFYRNLKEEFMKHNLAVEDYEHVIIDIFDILKRETIVDWHKNSEIKRVMYNKLDDYFYDEMVVKKGIKFGSEETREIINKIIQLAAENYLLF